MLVMRRREGEAIQIGQDIEVHILSVNGSKVKIGIVAPRNVAVSAREFELVRLANRAAADTPADAAAALANALGRRTGT